MRNQKSINKEQNSTIAKYYDYNIPKERICSHCGEKLPMTSDSYYYWMKKNFPDEYDKCPDCIAEMRNCRNV